MKHTQKNIMIFCIPSFNDIIKEGNIRIAALGPYHGIINKLSVGMRHLVSIGDGILDARREERA